MELVSVFTIRSACADASVGAEVPGTHLLYETVSNSMPQLSSRLVNLRAAIHVPTAGLADPIKLPSRAMSVRTVASAAFHVSALHADADEVFADGTPEMAVASACASGSQLPLPGLPAHAAPIRSS